METGSKLTVFIDKAAESPVKVVGGKARNIAICKKAGFKVPDGFCITTEGYRLFLNSNKLYYLIDKEVTRKSFDDMRWEEIWDSALRIRSSFMKGKMPKGLKLEIESKLSNWSDDTLFSIRSSSVEEDSKTYSFAGVHESFVNVSKKDVMEKVKLVWASLWNDRSLLYKKEKELDSAESAMAILIQKMEKRDISGLAFTIDPSKKDRDTAIIETIEGSLNFLVDNVEAPERVKIDKKTESIKEHILVGKKEILNDKSILDIFRKIIKLEELFKEPVDIEWTGLGEKFTVLQVRPITSAGEDPISERKWYLTLAPRGQKLIDLAEKVEKKLIPELQRESEIFSAVSIENLSKDEFLSQLKLRGESYEKWAKVYWDEFIPFAHGIRNFGIFYNDLVNPEDTYEFIYLLKTEDLLAYRRNDEMIKLAELLDRERSLSEELSRIIKSGYIGDSLIKKIKALDSPLSEDILKFLRENMSVGYEGISLEEKPEIPVNVIINLSESISLEKRSDRVDSGEYIRNYRERAKLEGIVEESEIWLKIGRVSWKLRDDDNILLGRLENQLLIFMKEGIDILKREGNIEYVPEKLNLKDWKQIYEGISEGKKITLHVAEEGDSESTDRATPRQLLGQPSSPGVYTGKARVIKSIEDFKNVGRGEVLIFDSVQPQMTFIISLAGAIVERRGGMLVHSSIIAREMHIPAVNGVTKVTKLIKNGDIVTVNGDLGIVTVGSTLFEI